jgi:hypothetical protein
VSAVVLKPTKTDMEPTCNRPETDSESTGPSRFWTVGDNFWALLFGFQRAVIIVTGAVGEGDGNVLYLLG